MKKILLLLFIAFSTNSIFSQNYYNPSFLSYYQASKYTLASPGAFKFGLYGFSNSAMPGFMHDSDMLIGFSSENTNFDNLAGWTVQSGRGLFGLNYGIVSSTNNATGEQVYDYRIGKAFGGRDFSLGLAYGFVGGDKSSRNFSALGRSNTAHLGFAWRPFEYLSIAGGQTWAIDNAEAETMIDIAIRPFGNQWLTLFADATGISRNTRGFEFSNYQWLPNISYSAGAIIEPLDGIRFSGRYISDQQFESFNVGFDISFGTTGIGGNLLNNSSANVDNSVTTLLRLGALDRTFFDDINPVKFFAKINLAGGLKYQRDMFFDNSKTLLNTIKSMDRIIENKSIAGVVINTVGFRANPSMRWEIREKIKEIKRSGKKVYMFMERGDLNDYHFASVADKIIMDEMGSMTLHGYVLGRSFYKNLFEKYNIGFNEIRLFKYKSAVESYSRESYSEGNIEQNQALLDSWFDTTLDEIVEVREDIDREDLEKIINTKMFINSEYALENNLIDATGRWHNLDSVMEDLDDDYNFAVNYGFIANKPVPTDDKWGYSSKSIAVVYVDGICAMEQGIEARKLVKYVEDVIKNPNIKAVVLRVDSPGGDALASEYIADVVRKNKGKKPIIVSQGMLAASGGYWLSMDGDEVLSSPYTITGSIGVISAWIYDKGAAEELGITTDKVQVGKYADLGFSWRDPLIGLGLPVRNITEDEEKQWKDNILDLYGDFVNRVAEGRGMDSIDVHEVAQGRIWSGEDAKTKGLVDEIGGLSDAIELAKSKTDIKKDDEVIIYEYPAPKVIDLQALVSALTGVKTDEVSERIETMKWLYYNRGLPMPMVPIEYLEYDINK